MSTSSQKKTELPLRVEFLTILMACFWGLKRFYKTHKAMPPEAYLNNPKHRAAVDALNGISGPIAKARHIFAYIFAYNRVRVKDTGGIDILFFGAALNEEKRFQFIEQILEGSLTNQTIKRYADLSTKHSPVTRKERFGYRIIILICLLGLRLRYGPVDTLSLQKTRVFFSTFFTCVHSFKHNVPRIVIVSNDHSAAQTGCASAARYIRVPCIYIQHAPVASYFPPLDFTLSILFNEQTVANYAKSGSIIGDHLVTSEFFERADRAVLAQTPTSPVTVGLFLPFSPILDAVQQVLQALQDNPQIARILIKPHPGASLSLVASNFSKAEILSPQTSNKELSARIGLAICCNSGVAVELLHHRTPCFYVRGLDDFGFDLYGFVASGLIPERAPTGLNGTFWRRTSQELSAGQSALQVFDPTCTASAEELHAQLRDKLLCLINPKSS